MNLRDLRYLVAVAEHKHFGRAAEACFISQPTLSTQLKKLEETLDVVLIERNHRQVMLTPVGEEIVAQAHRVLREVNRLVEIAEHNRDPMGGDFRLGIIPTVAPYLLPKILQPIRRAFPALKIQLTEGQTAQISLQLKNGALDAVILALPMMDEDKPEFAVAERKLYREPFYFAAATAHPKTKQQSVKLADLDDEKILLLEDGHCLRDQALAVCNTRNVVENTDFRASSLETLRQMVRANVGITLMPELALAKGGGVKYLPFRGNDGSKPYRDIGLCWRTSSTRAPLLEALAELLRAEMAAA